MKKSTIILLIALAAMAAQSKEITGNAINIINGYIFELHANDNTLNIVRLYGVDAPSLNQLHGNESKYCLSKLIYGQDVRVIYDRKDNWGYLLGKVYAGDTYVNKEMIASGNAWWEESYASDDKELKLAEQNAKASKLGVWSKPDSEKPELKDAMPAVSDQPGKDNADVLKTFTSLKKEIQNSNNN